MVSLATVSVLVFEVHAVVGVAGQEGGEVVGDVHLVVGEGGRQVQRGDSQEDVDRLCWAGLLVHIGQVFDFRKAGSMVHEAV